MWFKRLLPHWCYLIGILLAFGAIHINTALAADCWGGSDPDFYDGLAVLDNSGSMVKLKDIVYKSDGLTPSMMILKGLAGVDYSARHPKECWKTIGESIEVLNEYVRIRDLNNIYMEHAGRGVPWSYTPSGFIEEIYKKISVFYKNGQYDEVEGVFTRYDEMRRDSNFGVFFSKLDNDDLSNIFISCAALLKSTIISSASEFRIGHGDNRSIQVEFCSFESQHLDALNRLLLNIKSSGIIGGGAGIHWQHRIISDPKHFLRTNVLSNQPLWQYFSAWNWLQWQEIEHLAEPAIKELAAYYQSVWRLNQEDATLAASRAVATLSDMSITLPIPENDIRIIILRGGSIDKVAHAYATRVPDGFDDEGYRYLREKDSNFRDECHDPSYETTCKFRLYYDAYYRWDEHLVLLGTPEPPLLVGVMRPDVMAWLLDMGEDIEQVNQSGKTALMTAAHLNQLETVRLLLRRGADVDRRAYGPVEGLPDPGEMSSNDAYMHLKKPRPLQHAGRTALMYAAENADSAVIDQLLSAGADPCLVDSKGLSPRDYFVGPSPGGFGNTRIADQKERLRLSQALFCPAERHMKPAPFQPLVPAP